MTKTKFREDTDFMPAIHAATRRGAPLATHATLLLLGLLSFVLIRRARHAPLDGVPRARGLGLGVARLGMLISGERSIREVILFPQLRS